MGRIAIALSLLAAAATAARAEEHVHPYAPLAVALSGVIRNDHGGSAESTSAGANLELAVGRGAFQYFVEGSTAALTSGSGTERRVGAGVRWLARSFEINHAAAVELGLEGVGGYTSLRGTMDPRAYPDAGFGVAWALRVTRPRVLVRLSARAVFAQTSRDVRTDCRGTCETPTSVPGFVLLFGMGY